MVWQAQMRYLYAMSNWTIEGNACVDQFPPEKQWLCLFPQHAYPFIKARTFVLNSALDHYQVANFLGAEPLSGFPGKEAPSHSYLSGYNSSAAPGWATCSGDDCDLHACGVRQVEDMNAYMVSFKDALRGARTFHQEGNGAFIYGCNDHNAEMNDVAYRTYRVRNTTMRDALAEWWRSDGGQPAARHRYVDGGRYAYPASVTDTSDACLPWKDVSGGWQVFR
uniref:Uncharacterized protein n=1 Tax=Zooxanthella nutricula TaxID=1333877 RepID=A0A6U9JG84_9DINO